MGKEKECWARIGGKTVTGKALLESTEVIFRGDVKTKVPLSAIASVTVRGEWLELDAGEASLALKLGKDCELWAKTIRSPKSLLEKLGVKSGQRVAVLGLADEPAFASDLEAKGISLEKGAGKDLDAIFYEASAAADLGKLSSLKDRLAPAGALWIVRPKGKDGLAERDVMAAGKAAGLVDVKVVAFSAARTAEKYVIPVSARGT